MKVARSCLTLCNAMDSTVHGILQARVLERVAFPFSGESSWPRDGTQVSLIAGRFFTSWATRKAIYFKVPKINELLKEKWKLVVRSCLILSDPTDCSPPGSSVHRILQARMLDWVAISSSRESSQPRDVTLVSCIAGRFFSHQGSLSELSPTL